MSISSKHIYKTLTKEDLTKTSEHNAIITMRNNSSLRKRAYY